MFCVCSFELNEEFVIIVHCVSKYIENINRKIINDCCKIRFPFSYDFPF